MDGRGARSVRSSPARFRASSSLSFAMGTSGDGRVVVGAGWYGTDPANPCDLFTAYRWEESTGYVLLPPSLTGDYTRAHAVSADGRVVVGIDAALTGLWRGVKWVDGRHEFIQGPLGEVVSAWAVNRDGTADRRIGLHRRPSQPAAQRMELDRGRWRQVPHGGAAEMGAVGLRQQQQLQHLHPCRERRRARHGRRHRVRHRPGDEESVIWFDGEPVYLRDYLRANGYPDAFEDHANTGKITAVSADGRVLVGHNGGLFGAVNRWGFIVILPELGAK